MLAVYCHHVKVAKWLTKRGGADVHVAGQFGSAVDVARRAAAAEREGKRDDSLLKWLSRPCSRAGCAARGSTLCGRCELTRYCSRDCQTAHWRAGHEGECRPREA